MFFIFHFSVENFLFFFLEFLSNIFIAGVRIRVELIPPLSVLHGDVVS